MAKQKIESIYVIPPDRPRSVKDAIAVIVSFDELKPDKSFTPYEIGIRYTNGNEIRGQFTDKATAIAFLRDMR